MRRPLHQWRLGPILVRTILIGLLGVEAVFIARAGSEGAFADVVESVRPSRTVGLTFEDWQKNLEGDPSPGEILPIVEAVDSDGKACRLPSRGRAGGFLIIGSCTDCVAPYVARWNRLQQEHPEVDLYVVPLVVHPSDAKEYKELHDLGLRILVRNTDRLTDFCNPFFVPRVYFYDEHGTLRYIHSPAASTYRSLHAVERMMARRGKAPNDDGQ